MDTSKCLPCGCLHEAVDHLSALDPIVHAMGPTLEDAYELMQPVHYGCLGCRECPPVGILPLADRLAQGTNLTK
ncbi:MAG: hypothetical protein OEY97_12320 [Nitrospirota bacterium]|nr:hypothetical protein [Nitrospirota bacterium]